MKFNKITTKKATDAGLAAVEAGIGMAASNAAVGPVNSLVNNKMASKGIVAALGGLMFLAVPNTHAKALGAGMAIKQLWDLGSEAVAPLVADSPVLAEAFEANTTKNVSPELEKAMGRLAAARRGGSMGNPGQFKMGSPLRTGNGFIAG